MPEFLAGAAELAAPALETAFSAGAPAFGDVAGGVAGGLGSFGDLAAAGLPFGAGAGELGSVASGVGQFGLSGFADAIPAAAMAGIGGLGADAALAGLPSAAGFGQAGAVGAGNVGDVIAGLGPAAGTGAAVAAPAIGGIPGMTTSNAALPTASPAAPPSPTAAGGVTSVSPATSGSPAGSFNIGSFDAGAATPAAPAAPSAPGGVSGATDLTSAAGTNVAPGGAATPDKPNFLDKAVSGATNKLTNDPLGSAASLGGIGLLGYNLLGNKAGAAPAVPAVGATSKNITDTAAKLDPQAEQLRSYVTSGTLPAGLKTSLDQATKDAKTTAISNAAKNGQPTDPKLNTSLAAQLESIDRQAVISTAQIGKDLFSSGLDETKLSTDLYKTLVGVGQTDQKATTDALANFAKALGGLGSVGQRNLATV